MGMFDWYEPAIMPRCEVCSEDMTSCQGKDGPSVLATYRYGNALRGRPSTVKRTAPKTGRNDPYPCGSGKKFKNCCGKSVQPS